ncbi:MAG: hypothetical protein DRI61_15380, partial [Chloroflexi bacterium]
MLRLPQTRGLGRWRELMLRRHKVGGILIPSALCWGRISKPLNPLRNPTGRTAWARAKSPGLSSESPLKAGLPGRFQRPFSAQPGALSSRPSPLASM